MTRKKTTFLTDFKSFALRGNVLDLAVGVIIGGAFGKIVSSLVSDIFMPLIGIITGGVDISSAFIALDGRQYANVETAIASGAPTLHYGAFLQNIIDFLLVAFCIFVFTRYVGKLARRKKEAHAKLSPACPFCKMEVAEGATRCPHCTSRINGGGVDA